MSTEGSKRSKMLSNTPHRSKNNAEGTKVETLNSVFAFDGDGDDNNKVVTRTQDSVVKLRRNSVFSTCSDAENIPDGTVNKQGETSSTKRGMKQEQNIYMRISEGIKSPNVKRRQAEINIEAGIKKEEEETEETSGDTKVNGNNTEDDFLGEDDRMGSPKSIQTSPSRKRRRNSSGHSLEADVNHSIASIVDDVEVQE